eukprot:scaffold2556_cov425-Prasinococcus_capsulatus_cf.AAC.1
MLPATLSSPDRKWRLASAPLLTTLSSWREVIQLSSSRSESTSFHSIYSSSRKASELRPPRLSSASLNAMRSRCREVSELSPAKLSRLSFQLTSSPPPTCWSCSSPCRSSIWP